jgi:hypothetical protein
VLYEQDEFMVPKPKPMVRQTIDTAETINPKPKPMVRETIDTAFALF